LVEAAIERKKPQDLAFNKGVANGMKNKKLRESWRGKKKE